VGMLTDGALSTPASTFALLRRACGPRSDVMEASGTDGDAFALGCAGGVSVVCARAGMTLTLISAVPIILGVAAWSEALELVHVTAVLTGLLMGPPPSKCVQFCHILEGFSASSSPVGPGILSCSKSVLTAHL
jgi:hypothetical protein